MQSDPYTAWRVLDLVDDFPYGRRILQQIAEAGSRQQGRLMDALVLAVERARDTKLLSGKRVAIRDADHRFFLALLMNVPSRSRIFQLVRERNPASDPADSIVGWLRDLSGQASPDGQRGDALGLGLELDESALWVIRSLLRGETEAELRDTARAGRVPEGLSVREADVAKLCLLLPHTSVFRPLLVESSVDEAGRWPY